MDNKIMMLGTGMSNKGGISSVVKDYQDYGILKRLGINYYATHRDGTKLVKLLFFVSQFSVILVKMPFYKIIHFHTATGWSYRRLSIIFSLAWLYRKQTIWHIHTGELHLYYDNASTLEKQMIKFVLRNADVVIALSSNCNKMIEDIEPRASIKILLNTVNVNDYQIDDRKLHDPIKVLLLGRLEYRKGIHDILKAIEILADNNICFVLAGDGDIEGTRKFVKDNSFEKIVSVPGWISGDQKLTLLKEADIYILPSYQEGLPISILEAMSAGLPIVSTPVGGIPDAVIDGENGYLIEPGDFKALASKILLLSEDHNLWKKLSLRSSEIAKQKFHMSRIETELTDLYNKLISST
ncbi:MAG: glycosyltransferase family 4 protein [Methylococcales bacterium]